MENYEGLTPEEYIKYLEDELAKEKKARNEDKKFYEAMEAEYDKEVKQLHKELNATKGKMLSQQIILESYKAKVGTPLIIEGKEPDLYPGEQKDFILELLTVALNNSDKLSRTRTICESILKANQEAGRRRKINEAVGAILKKYDGKDILGTIDRINEAGLTAEKTKSGHIRITLNNDSRYIVTLSGTPSDFRCGMNALADIHRVFF